VRAGPPGAAPGAGCYLLPVAQRLIGLLALLTVVALLWVARQPAGPPPPDAGARTGIPRTTLDHQGQPAAALPDDPKVPVTGR
jgi:hypothetical protein